MRSKLRLGHYSQRTEQAYLGWVLRFVRHHRLRHPADLGETDVIALDDLVKDGKVQKSSVLLDMRLAAAEGFAVLLLDTSSGLRALRVSAEGKATPVAIGTD